MCVSVHLTPYTDKSPQTRPQCTPSAPIMAAVCSELDNTPLLHDDAPRRQHRAAAHEAAVVEEAPHLRVDVEASCCV